ncbi:hypothetical protein TGPRC2_313322 [Toxoplasma gondii TgCatPRC2]|uniref:Uncharacterized protein n=13 Tax=Toxoplasma gondii TaxID=5811 RepID=A0A125YS83_TOXGV|nr:hypothetical protein TGME49_313322 [Toxoplasma gondii ME49]ESS35074.1 hypothetical protein TGVEG_313322 [Toxoplasma gondii VEG]KFG37428.1 hypothetical protein TGDOM2_313322 [Toxoplasma gondii GAB2-2007-GAL-DOM2]KFG50044.1 hypothetical protein TGP89_313322 [Toxoplasma gondii p89]KFG56119.1 hypothetical protein TGFOU_313322 [Toxoplasma gondii FOU]KFG66104.1 hypothetical protein TGRUB_313322 [Toxoplasma gondii RUB]KFH09806.1 hypothetical protein TGVAND_313322 [Toxoplasma gondii VAND]KFH17797|eukprot:XP_018635434.1 hypothetical protein TGME49_313322 [Toxoplasma gondii ME49]
MTLLRHSLFLPYECQGTYHYGVLCAKSTRLGYFYANVSTTSLCPNCTDNAEPQACASGKAVSISVVATLLTNWLCERSRHQIPLKSVFQLYWRGLP